MSNAVTVLNGAKSSGLISVSDAGLQGMITLRGDLASPAMARAVKNVTGTKIPAQRQIETSTKGKTAWMSPDELLLFVEYSAADDACAKLSKALAKEHHLVANVSDARCVINMSGKHIRDVLAKGSPADMARDALGIGEIRRTRLGQLPVAFWLSDEKTASLVCFRSVGAHVFNWLETAAQKGSDVNFH